MKKSLDHLPLRKQAELRQVVETVRAAFEEVTGEPSPGYGIDGCSAPNFATSVAGLARAMAAFADPGADARGQAMARLTAAMTAHPELVAGEGRACTLLMRAMGGRVAVKTGAEAVFVAIAPERGMGIALKIADGATRASEAAITALLVRLGLLDAGHPVVGKYLTDPLRNWRGIAVAERRLTRGDALPLIAAMRTGHFAPGSAYSYCNANFRLLAEMIEAETGETLREAAAQLAVEGWTPIAAAGRWIADQRPEQLPAKYGCISWRQVVHECRLFELRYREVEGQRAAWYRPREA